MIQNFALSGKKKKTEDEENLLSLNWKKGKLGLK